MLVENRNFFTHWVTPLYITPPEQGRLILLVFTLFTTESWKQTLSTSDRILYYTSASV